MANISNNNITLNNGRTIEINVTDYSDKIDNNTMCTALTKVKKKRRNKSDLGANFVAPDGGWGWLICLGAGCANVSNHFNNIVSFYFLIHFLKMDFNR
jgi:hypothetical protein